MGQDAHLDFPPLSPWVARAQGRSQPAFALAEGTFDLPALSVSLLVERLVHLTTVLPADVLPVLGGSAGFDGRPRSQPEAHHPMVDLAVVAGVGHQMRKGLGLMGVQHHPAELLAVPAGALVHQDRDEQMAEDVADGGELREMLHPAAATLAEVMTYVVGFEARRVHGHHLAAGGQKVMFAGQVQRGVQELIETPFFSSRRRAQQKVE